MLTGFVSFVMMYFFIWRTDATGYHTVIDGDAKLRGAGLGRRRRGFRRRGRRRLLRTEGGRQRQGG